MRIVKQFLFWGIIGLVSSTSFAQKTKKLKRNEIKLIESGNPNVPLRVLKIDNKEDSIFLRKLAWKFNYERDREKIIYLSKRLIATVKDPSNMGVGIAAPQVGLRRRLIVVQRFDKPDKPFEVYVNPKLVSCSEEKKEGKEGCLSIPNRSGKVFRAVKISVEYLDLEGRKHIEDIEGFTSVIFQHEIDHLNGILYIDHLEQER